MSIAQARASMIRSHYIFVALLLGVMAAIAFGTLATQAAAGDTQVRASRAARVGTFGNGTTETADPILSDGSVDLSVQADLCRLNGTNRGWGSDHLRWGVGLRKWSKDDDHCVDEPKRPRRQKTEPSDRHCRSI